MTLLLIFFTIFYNVLEKKAPDLLLIFSLIKREFHNQRLNLNDEQKRGSRDK